MKRGRKLANLALQCNATELQTQIIDKNEICRPPESDNSGKFKVTEQQNQIFDKNGNCKPTNNVNSVVETIHTRLKVYEEQLIESQRNDNKSKVKRKLKRIAQLKSFLFQAKNGQVIDISHLPDPTNSPDTKRSRLTDNDNNFDRILDCPESDLNFSPDYDVRRKILYTTTLQDNNFDRILDCPESDRNLSPGYDVRRKIIFQTTSLQENDDNSIFEEAADSKERVQDKVNKKMVKEKKTTRKENYCLECKKFVKEFCKHFEAVHQDTVEGKKLLALNQIKDKFQKKKLKMAITDILRKKGNAEYSKNHRLDSFLLGEHDIVIPVKRSSKDITTNHVNTVQCAHCEGFYRRRKFSQHLQRCYNYKNLFSNKENDKTQTLDSLEGNILALKEHSLPVVDKVPGASKQLMDEVIMFMKPRAIKDVALRDPLIMKYASEFHKTRRADFQKMYVSRIITDLAKILICMQEVEGQKIKCLEDVFNPAHFSILVKVILEEGGYDETSGSVEKCGLANRLRSHIKGAAETAKKDSLIEEYEVGTSEGTSRSKRLKHFLKILDEKWANEVGRIFDTAVKKSRAETQPKLAAEDDIVKTCEFITSQYRNVIANLEKNVSGSVEKQNAYNRLLDLVITHIMCLIRRRPVDFKRALNSHYEKLDLQEDLINEIKNSKHMTFSDNDLQLCNKFHIFFVPGKGWKELVPIALTNIMREAMDAIQKNKLQVGVKSNKLFIRAKDMVVNPRECLRKVTANLVLKKPMDFTGNGLRHHAATFSKLHSSHPNYQDYLASALGHTLHIHRLHYEMPTSIVQKLIVCPVLHSMTQPLNERQQIQSNEDNLQHVDAEQLQGDIQESIVKQFQAKQYTTPEKFNENTLSDHENSDNCHSSSSNESSRPKQYGEKKLSRSRWSDEEKKIIYDEFGEHILEYQVPPRRDICKLYFSNRNIFGSRTIDSLVTFLHNKCTRKQKNVTPEIKKFMAETHRKFTNVPI